MIIIGIDRRPLSGIDLPYQGMDISQCDIFKNYHGKRTEAIILLFIIRVCLCTRSYGTLNHDDELSNSNRVYTLRGIVNSIKKI